MHERAVVAVQDVLSSAGSEAHGNCVKAVLHRIPAAETSLFSVTPGETLKAHVHPRTWDLFFGIAGSAEIAYEGEGGQGHVQLGPRSFCAMPPGWRHEVRNLSRSEPVTFLLIHAPWEGYEFVPSPAEGAGGRPA